MGPMIIYFTKQFWQKRHHLFIKKRYPKTTLFICTASILIIMFERLSSSIENFIRPLNLTLGAILWWIHMISYPFLSHGIVWVAMTRYWTIYYDFNWSIMLFDNKWKAYIDPITMNMKENWFFRHKVKYGNIQWFGIRIFIIYVIIALCSTTIFTVAKLLNINLFWALIIDSFFFTVPLILCLYIWCKTPRFHDTLYISLEMKYTSILFIVGLICYIAISCSIFLPAMIQNALLISLAAIVFFSYSMITTWWVLYKMNKSKIIDSNDNVMHTQEAELIDYLSISSKSEYMVGTQKETEKDNNKKKHVRLQQILRDKEFLDLFVIHILNEFSLEILVCIIELIQFKSTFGSFDDVNIDQNVISIISDAIFENKDIPKSFIVYGELDKIINYYTSERNMNFIGFTNKINKYKDDKNDQLQLILFQLRAYCLYKKYIESECELEINIAFNERERLKSIFTDLNKIEISIGALYTVFDEVIHEMVILLKFSYNRFKTTEQYKNVLFTKSNE